MVEKMSFLVNKGKNKKVVKMVRWLLLLLEWRRRWRREWWRSWWKKLVVEEMENGGRWPAKRRLGCCWLAGNERKEEEGKENNERERRSGSIYIKGSLNYYNLATPNNETCVSFKKAASPKMDSASG